MIRRTCALAAIGFGMVASAGIAQAKDYTVAILQSLTGPAAYVGVGVKDGGLVAAEELNKMQFLGPGNRLKVIVDDDGNDRGQVVTAMQRYAVDPDILVVMGPTVGPIAVAGLAVANDKHVPTVANTNSLAALQMGPWGFIATSPAAVAIPYIASYTVDVLKAKKCASIGPNDNEALVTLRTLFDDYLTAHGVQIASSDGYKMTDSDFSALATKIAGLSDVDCIYIGSLAPQAANIIRQLKQAGLGPNVHIIGSNGFAAPALVQQGGTAVEGVYLMGDWVPGGDSADGRAFDAAYKARTGNEPENWNAMGYSTMRVIATAIKAAMPDVTRDSIRAALVKTKDVPVVVGQGRYSLDADRVPHYGIVVLTVRNGRFALAPR